MHAVPAAEAPVGAHGRRQHYSNSGAACSSGFLRGAPLQAAQRTAAVRPARAQRSSGARCVISRDIAEATPASEEVRQACRKEWFPCVVPHMIIHVVFRIFLYCVASSVALLSSVHEQSAVYHSLFLN